MNDRLRAKLALAGTVLNADGSVTPGEDLPEGLLVEGSEIPPESWQKLLDSLDLELVAVPKKA